MANYESANRNLERARAKNRDIPVAETAQTEACEKFEGISALAKQGKRLKESESDHLFANTFLLVKHLFAELTDFKKRRVVAFRKYLVDMTELQIKHAKVNRFIGSEVSTPNFQFAPLRKQSQVQLIRNCISTLNDELLTEN